MDEGMSMSLSRFPDISPGSPDFYHGKLFAGSNQVQPSGFFCDMEIAKISCSRRSQLFLGKENTLDIYIIKKVIDNLIIFCITISPASDLGQHGAPLSLDDSLVPGLANCLRVPGH